MLAAYGLLYLLPPDRVGYFYKKARCGVSIFFIYIFFTLYKISTDMYVCSMDRFLSGPITNSFVIYTGHNALCVKRSKFYEKACPGVYFIVKWNGRQESERKM